VEPTLVGDDAPINLGRGMASGGLHAWSVAWVPGEGWIPLESTSGQIANTDVYAYHVELFPADESKEDICTSKSYDYAEACHDKNLLNLNKEGLGLMEEVTVR
jgi:transglutaminase-like putative cysteine protease